MRPRRIHIHMDVNGTVTAQDPAAGLSPADALAKAISAAAHGKSCRDGAFLFRDMQPLEAPEAGTISFFDHNCRYATAWHRHEGIAPKQMHRLHDKYATRLEEEHGFLLNPLWRLLEHLDDAQYDWVLLFRTMGKDLPRVKEELAAQGRSLHGDGFLSGRDAVNDPAGFAEYVDELPSGTIAAVQDDFRHWQRNGFRHDAGKVVVMDPSRHATIVFDDYIRPWDLSEIGIFNVMRRDPAKRTLSSLTRDDMDPLFGRVLHRANLVSLLEDPDFFVRRVAEAMADGA